jgi:hypothetical protein
LSALGGALKYFVEKELPVEKGKRNPQAVDVAWLSEKGQDFPLMIFEVESKVTNAVANNPLKVFGKPNQTFEKPLFFFHIMVSGGQETSRIEDLRYQFGSHNYRVYRLADNETNQLVKDILSQHRRLTNEIDLISIVDALESVWSDIDVDSILLHIEELGFERGGGTFIPRYAALSRTDAKYQKHFVRYLQTRENAHPALSEEDAYSSYLGYQWSVPIHLGILAVSSPEGDKEQYFQRLRQWQEHSSYMTMIGPHLGLSRDYDDFILGLAPALWALIALLMHDIPEAVNYIAQQCRDILERVETAPVDTSFFTALWLLHISASCDLSLEHYEFSRAFINERGGVPEQFLYEPIGVLSLEEESEWLTDENYTFIDVPPIQNFRSSVKAHNSPVENVDSQKIALALEALLDDATIRFWSPMLVQLLHCK